MQNTHFMTIYIFHFKYAREYYFQNIFNSEIISMLLFLLDKYYRVSQNISKEASNFDEILPHSHPYSYPLYVMIDIHIQRKPILSLSRLT